MQLVHALPTNIRNRHVIGRLRTAVRPYEVQKKLVELRTVEEAENLSAEIMRHISVRRTVLLSDTVDSDSVRV